MTFSRRERELSSSNFPRCVYPQKCHNNQLDDCGHYTDEDEEAYEVTEGLVVMTSQEGVTSVSAWKNRLSNLDKVGVSPQNSPASVFFL